MERAGPGKEAEKKFILGLSGGAEDTAQGNPEQLEQRVGSGEKWGIGVAKMGRVRLWRVLNSA